jgi:hypothetical protein
VAQKPRWIVISHGIVISQTDKLRMLQLAPGASLADPVLQRDAARGIHAHAAQGKPGGCDA